MQKYFIYKKLIYKAYIEILKIVLPGFLFLNKLKTI